jgi:hypothetical protein
MAWKPKCKYATYIFFILRTRLSAVISELETQLSYCHVYYWLVDGVWIGESIYWILTSRKCKYYNTLRISVTITHETKSSTSIFNPQSSGTLSLKLCLTLYPEISISGFRISTWAGFTRTGDRTPDTTVHSSVIRRCHENMCQYLGKTLIYPRVFVAAEAIV